MPSNHARSRPDRTSRTGLDVEPGKTALLKRRHGRRRIEPARISLRLTGGGTIERRVDVVRGSPQARMSEAERIARFHDCLAFGVGATRAEPDRLAKVLLDIEHAPDAAAAIVHAFPAMRERAA